MRDYYAEEIEGKRDWYAEEIEPRLAVAEPERPNEPWIYTKLKGLVRSPEESKQLIRRKIGIPEGFDVREAIGGLAERGLEEWRKATEKVPLREAKPGVVGKRQADIILGNIEKAALALPRLPIDILQQVFFDERGEVRKPQDVPKAVAQVGGEFLQYPLHVLQDYVIYISPTSTPEQRRQAIEDIAEEPEGLPFTIAILKGGLKGGKRLKLAVRQAMKKKMYAEPAGPPIPAEAVTEPTRGAAIHYGRVLGEEPVGRTLEVPPEMEPYKTWPPTFERKSLVFETEVPILEAKEPTKVVPKRAKLPYMEQMSSIDGEVVRVGKKEAKTYHNSPVGWVEYRTKVPAPKKLAKQLDEFVKPETKVEVAGRRVGKGKIAERPLFKDWIEQKGYKWPIKQSHPEYARLIEEYRTEFPETPKPEKLYAGLPIPGLEALSEKISQKIAEITKPESDISRNINEAIGKWYSDRNLAAYDAENIAREIRKITPKGEESLICNAREQPARFETELSEGGKKVLDILGREYDKYHRIAEEAGLIDTYIENYVTHIYKDKPEVIQRILSRSAAKLSPKFRFGKARKIPTLEEAKSFGLHPIEDPAALLGIYHEALFKTLANKNLIDILKELKNERGLELFLPKGVAPNDYAIIGDPIFSRYMGYGGKEPLMADPTIARAIDNIVDPYKPRGAWNRAYVWVRGKVKRIIMYNPLIHGSNIFSDVVDEMNFKIGKAFNETFLKNLAEREPELSREFIENGGSWKYGNELRESLLNNSPREVADILKPIKAIERWNDTVLWDRIVRNAQLSIYKIQKTKGLKRGLSTKEAGLQAARYANTLTGTLPAWWMSKLVRQAGSILFFARNWTYSNLMMAFSAIPKVKAAGLFKGMNEAQIRALKTSYAKHIVKGVGGLVGFVNIMNYALSGHSSFENEPGHRLDIDIGMKDNKGRQIYITSPLFRYIHDYINWIGKPARTFTNKMEPVLKSAVELVSNYSIWRRQPIRHPGASTPEQIRDVGQYLTEALLPAEELLGREGEVKPTFEKLVPLTGTWVRHGVAGGEYAKKMIEYRQKKEYKQRELDKKLDEFIQRGETEAAVGEMIESGRYTSPEGIIRRLIKYEVPLHLKWNALSTRDKIAFLQSLSEKEREEFRKRLAEERP